MTLDQTLRRESQQAMFIRDSQKCYTLKSYQLVQSYWYISKTVIRPVDVGTAQGRRADPECLGVRKILYKGLWASEGAKSVEHLAECIELKEL